jgi:hypothetical protein
MSAKFGNIFPVTWQTHQWLSLQEFSVNCDIYWQSVFEDHTVLVSAHAAWLVKTKGIFWRHAYSIGERYWVVLTKSNTLNILESTLFP